MPQWYQFFVYSNSENKTVPYSDMMLAGLYLLYKVMMLPYYFLNWYNSTRSMCGLSLVGTVPSRADLAHFSQCTICVSNAVNPLKLPCGHVFCRQCIHTWLETENTCPNCRKDTPTPLQDVSWKGGGTTYFLQFC
ncbi:unnamed protein product [Anisakis simplex]|uniref:RING-type domain-containing protein n=1 Tax=Anisakis simplex TaxID=6269 RepID=A0A0M3JQZ9_ANISI|nr:unnamed protein product [Anisakis simplex]